MTPAQSETARILVATTGVADARMIAQLLGAEFDRVRISSDPDRAVADFEDYRPQVLVLGFKQLEESEAYYLGLYRLSTRLPTLPHRTVILCTRENLERVYALCKKQYFDDYVLFWPVSYDAPRLCMAVHQALRALKTTVSDEPSAAEFANQARRIADLETALQQALAQGSVGIDQLNDSLRHVEADVGAALSGFSRRCSEGETRGAPGGADHAGFQHELARLRDEALQQPFAAIGELTAPMRQWLGGLNQRLAPQLQSARDLLALAQRVRPKILFVDDDPIQHRLLEIILSNTGIDLCFADSGTAALAALRTERPDLILMDFNLPDLSGVEVVRRLKAAPATANIPVIMITGTTTKAVVVDSREAGAIDFMAKPFDKARLLAKIGHHLALHPAAEAQ